MVDDNKIPNPTYELISPDHPVAILEKLIELGVCQNAETIKEIAKAGEGNMNLVLRIKTDQRSVIVKQARPWVEKYPDIAAPEERILYEIEFYRCIAGSNEVSNSMPSVLASDVDQRLMVLEDLGTASDYSMLYGNGASQVEVDTAFENAMHWVAQLHQCDIGSERTVDCKPLRQLNHQHIFSIPLMDPPAINLDQVCDGLTEASRNLCTDDAVRQAMSKLGELYLEGDGSLLHGDFYPGSWLKTAAGFRVIDPEFCFCGPPEFDLGILAAHWIFCGGSPDSMTVDRVSQSGSNKISNILVTGFAGAELVRRLIGVAQLPLDANLHQRIEWLDCGVRFLKRAIEDTRFRDLAAT